MDSESLDRWRGKVDNQLSDVKADVATLVADSVAGAAHRNRIETEVTKLSTKISIYVPLAAFGVSTIMSVIIGILVAVVTAYIKTKSGQ